MSEFTERERGLLEAYYYILTAWNHVDNITVIKKKDEELNRRPYWKKRAHEHLRNTMCAWICLILAKHTEPVLYLSQIIELRIRENVDYDSDQDSNTASEKQKQRVTILRHLTHLGYYGLVEIVRWVRLNHFENGGRKQVNFERSKEGDKRCIQLGRANEYSPNKDKEWVELELIEKDGEQWVELKQSEERGKQAESKRPQKDDKQRVKPMRLQRSDQSWVKVVQFQKGGKLRVKLEGVLEKELEDKELEKELEEDSERAPVGDERIMIRKGPLLFEVLREFMQKTGIEEELRPYIGKKEEAERTTRWEKRMSDAEKRRWKRHDSRPPLPPSPTVPCS